MTAVELETITEEELHAKVQTLLGLMTLAHPSFHEFLDWVSDYVTDALIQPDVLIEALNEDIQSAKEIVTDKTAQAMAHMPTAGGIH